MAGGSVDAIAGKQADRSRGPDLTEAYPVRAELAFERIGGVARREFPTDAHKTRTIVSIPDRAAGDVGHCPVKLRPILLRIVLAIGDAFVRRASAVILVSAAVLEVGKRVLCDPRGVDHQIGIGFNGRARNGPPCFP